MLAFEATARPMAHPDAKGAPARAGWVVAFAPISIGFLTKLLRLTIAYARDWRQNRSNHMPAEILRGYFGFWWVPGCP